MYPKKSDSQYFFRYDPLMIIGNRFFFLFICFLFFIFTKVIILVGVCTKKCFPSSGEQDFSARESLQLYSSDGI